LTNVFTRSCVLLSFLAFLGGCFLSAQNEPPKFYLLRSTSQAQSELKGRKVSVGVGPVDLPPYVDRPQIVTQTAGNELNINEFNRWAEPLHGNFTRVMAENLGLLLGTDQVFAFPWGGSVAIDYQVKVEVAKFIGQLGGESSLVARWSILGDKGRKVLLTRRSQLQVVSSDARYDSLVTAMNQTLTDLSREIAGAIRSLKRK
jgi:uncharacterized protein